MPTKTSGKKPTKTKKGSLKSVRADDLAKTSGGAGGEGNIKNLERLQKKEKEKASKPKG